VATFTFGALPTIVTFSLLLAQPEQTRQAQSSVRHIPGGDTNYVDIGGKEPAYINGGGKFSSFVDFAMMRDNVGVAGTLVYSEATYLVYLLKVARRKVDGKGTGVHIADVQFLLNQ
jgi:hypothetical protein